jgi:hypothetical protein
MTDPNFDRKEHAMNNEIEMILFESEVVLPGQMSWGGRYDDNTSGTRALMLAILADALLCVERGRRRRHRRTRRLAAEAETWMRADCRGWLFSFASICDVLEIDADALRARLLLTNVEHPANGGRAARAEAGEPPTRSRDVTRLLPQRGSTRGSIAADTTREPTRRSVRGGQTGPGFAVRARLEVA